MVGGLEAEVLCFKPEVMEADLLCNEGFATLDMILLALVADEVAFAVYNQNKSEKTTKKRCLFRQCWREVKYILLLP